MSRPYIPQLDQRDRVFVLKFDNRWCSFVWKTVVIEAEVTIASDQHNHNEPAAKDTVWWHI